MSMAFSLIAIAASIAFFSSAVSQCSLPGVSSKPFALGVALVMGPAANSWLLWLMLEILPRQSPLFYLGLMALVWAGLAALVLSKDSGGWLDAAKDWIRKLRETWAPLGRTWKLVFGLVGLGTFTLIALTVFVTLGQPLMASDPLEYQAVARVIADARSLDVYPIDQPRADNGLYARSSHPPAFHILIVFNYFAHGSIELNVVMRWIQLAIFAGTALMLCSAGGFICPGGRRTKFAAGLVTLVLLVSVSYYLALVADLHVDPLRIGTLSASFFLIVALSQQIGEGGKIALPLCLAGFCLGISLFSHSIGLLNLFICGLVFMLFTRATLPRYLACGAALFFISVTVGGYQYVENMVLFGVPVHDAEPVWDLPNIDHETDVRYRREMVIFVDRLWSGALTWLTKPGLFGFSHWIILFTLPFFSKEHLNNTFFRAVITYIAIFYFVVAVTLVAGIDLIIKNSRYMLTIMPFAVIISGQLAIDAVRRIAPRLLKGPRGEST